MNNEIYYIYSWVDIIDIVILNPNKNTCSLYNSEALLPDSRDLRLLP